MRKSSHVCLGFCLLLLVLLISACGNISTTDNVKAQSPATSTVPATKTVTLSPKQLLEKSSNAMNALTAVHFTLDAKRQDITPTATTPAGDILQALLPLPGRNSFNSWKQGEGDEGGTNNSQVSLKEIWGAPPFDNAHSGRVFAMDQRIQGDNVYLLGDPIANQKWYVISKQILTDQAETQVYAVSGMSQIQALLDLSLQKGTLSDKGQESIGGTTLHHIQATFSEKDRTALRAIDVENYSYTFASMQTKNTEGSSDFWIDENTGYVYRVVSTIVYKTNNSGPAAATIQQTLTFNCSHFNQPVNISIPQRPIQANNIDQIYPIIPS